MPTNANHCNDRNFDDIADHFERKIYSATGKGYLKGLLRQKIIHRDLQNLMPGVLTPGATPSLNILDAGAGLGQFCIALSKAGHQVIYNDISSAMMQKAQIAATDAGVLESIIWRNHPYQELIHFSQAFDLVLCHALLEWLENPLAAIEILSDRIKPGGWLSLCVYNPAGKIMRNLICGNFKLLDAPQSAAPKGRSLTPVSAPELGEIEDCLANNRLKIKQRSGIRVFSDYVLEKRGGNQFEEEVIRMEMKYAQHPELVRTARYVHLLATRY